ncbi:MAG TPA: molybdopterin-dependent oxidoreductase [Luteitalea sp.]|nr:molybdopterin-dependent oxidoreductase [Luteitalea sp.]
MLPFGLDRQKPRHYRDMLRIVWENRDQLPYAWRILTQGVCDGCALGTSGLKDWTLDGPHLCMVRLELLRLNTAPALDPTLLADVRTLASTTSAGLRALGRLPAPMLRRAGEPGFRVVGWDEALDRAARGLRETDPARTAFFLTSRGITNETYYVAQKAARALGTNHVDNAARLCHAASTIAMKAALGHGAATCSYTDWLDADLIVLFGSNVANNQPVTTKYLHEARRRGAQIAVVNTYREPGLQRYWVPSVASSALFGTALTDHWFDVHTGGDLAFLVGVLRALIEMRGVDEAFVSAYTSGFEEARTRALASDWAALEADSGTTRAQMEAFARLLVERPNAVFIWSMGLTQHVHGVETVAALMNVGLARGLPGRPNRGLVPIRGHSGVQGGAEMGCVPSLDATSTARFAATWGFDLPDTPGWTTTAMIDHAAAGDIDAFWIVGGNFLETLPDEDRTRRALRRPALRVHQDIMLSSGMLADSDGDVLILPATTRYESPGGGTETSTERRVIFSPEVRGRRVGTARPEWQVIADAVTRARPDRAAALRFSNATAVRAEIARAVPLYAGIETLQARGDQIQWGGRTLYEGGRFATADGRAHFAALESTRPARASTAVSSSPQPQVEPGARPSSQVGPVAKRDEAARRSWVPTRPIVANAVDATFRVSTRRGKQFNSMIQRETDPLNGARRDDVLISAIDVERLGLREGQVVELCAESGVMAGRVRTAPIVPGNLAVHWPEGNVLLAGGLVDPASKEPDYNAMVVLRVPVAVSGATSS